MSPYRETIRRYRRVLRIPIILCVVMALWTVAGAPKQYESTASLWVDRPAPAPSSLTDTNALVDTPPAQQEQEIFTELLSTRDFQMAVAKRGPLARYLASKPSAGWGPMALLGGLKGAPSLDSQVTSALGAKKLTTTVAGPQVLQVSLKAGTPAVAAGTVQALVDEVNARLSSFAAQRNRTTLAVSQAAVEAASKGVQAAQQRVQAYKQANPSVTGSDPHFAALIKAARAAARDLSATTSRLNEVSSGKTAADTATTFSVIDPPRQPPGPVSGKKKLILAIFGGLFAGLVLSGLVLLALTPSRPPLPERPELRPVPDPVYIADEDIEALQSEGDRW